MKISAGAGFLDIAAPAPGGGGAGSGTATAEGEDFGELVRKVGEDLGDAASEKTAQGKPQNKAGDAGHAAKAGKTRNKDDDSVEPATAANNAGPGLSAAEVLGRLLGVAPGTGPSTGPTPMPAFPPDTGQAAAGTAAVALDAAVTTGPAADPDAAATAFDGALSERLVITPIGALSDGGAVEGKAGAKGKGGVGLEVLHMETHFEPRSDDFVLVEGATPQASTPAAPPVRRDALDGMLSAIRAATPVPREISAATAAVVAVAQKPEPSGSARARGPDDAVAAPMRFDEAVARLGTQDGASSGTDGGERQDPHGAPAGLGRSRATGATDAPGDDARTTAPARQTAAPAANADEAAMPTALPVGSMTSQIAGRVIDAFRAGSAAAEAADRPSGDTHLRLTAGGAALKTLTIQLQPENLGMLEVSMRLVDGNLTLELAASEHATAVALSHDRAGLKKLLEHAGFSMDEASISIVTRDATAAMTRAGASADAGGAPQGGQGGSGGDARNGSGASGERGGFARDSGSGGREAPAGGARGRGEAELEAPARRRSSVFL